MVFYNENDGYWKMIFAVIMTLLLLLITYYTMMTMVNTTPPPPLSAFMGDPRMPRSYLSVMSGTNQADDHRDAAIVSGFKNRSRSGFNANEAPVFWESPAAGMNQVEAVYSPDTEAFAADRLTKSLLGM
jgi:hypothetical protein